MQVLNLDEANDTHHPEEKMAQRPPNSETSPGEARYVPFQTLPNDATWNGKPALNKYSSYITNHHDFPAAKVRSQTRRGAERS